MHLPCFVAALTFIALATEVAAQEKLTLSEYTYKEGKFTIRVPGKVTESQKQLKVGEKFATMHTATIEIPSKTGKRSIVMTSLELAVPVPAGQEKAKIAAIAKAAAGKGRLISDKAIDFGKDKLPGQDCLIERQDHYVRYRGILAGQRIYQLMVTGSKEFVTSKDAEAILDSFEVIK